VDEAYQREAAREERVMTRQDIVRMSYSQAEARRQPALDQNGQPSPQRQECWTIGIRNGHGYLELGQGATQEEAWVDAARKLIPTPVSHEGKS
jgi:hypothetical protein